MTEGWREDAPARCVQGGSKMKRAILSLVLMFVCAFWGMILLDEILGPTSGLLCALISGIACIVYVLDNPLEK